MAIKTKKSQAAKTAKQPRPHHPKQKTIKAWRLQLAIFAGVLLFGAGVAYFAVFPRLIADRHDTAVAAPAANLKKTFDELEKGADLTTELTTNGPTRDKANQTLTQQIRTARQQLDELDAANGKLTFLPLANTNKHYEQARIAQRGYRWLAGQSRAVLGDYERLIGYLNERDRQSGVLRGHLDRFNSETDLNRLIGQQARFQTAANEIDQAAAALDSLGQPPGTPAGTADTAATYRQAADDFRDLAGALAAASDARIYASAVKLEAISRTLDETESGALTKAVQESATVREVRTLPERLDTATL